MTAEEIIARLHWLGHDSFRIDGPPVIYLDPWQLPERPPIADLVLVSHEHHDHCSPADVDKISGPDTVVLASATAVTELPGAHPVAPGDRVEAVGALVEAVPAYNTNKFRSPGVPFHPQQAGHVGFVVTIGGVRVYFAGDTDHIPEMAEISCDVALLPVSGIYVMTADEAADAARTLNPKIVVPMHYGSGIGAADDGQRFSQLYEGQTILMTAGE